MSTINTLCHALFACGLHKAAHGFVETTRRAGYWIWVYDSLPHGYYRPIQGWEKGCLSILHVQPHVMNLAYPSAGVAFNPHIRHIGYWYWETDCVPADWIDTCEQFQVKEIWAPTPFVRKAIQNRIKNIPVYNVLPYIQPPGGLEEADCLSKLDPAAYKFLYAFDFGSVFWRKNPDMLIRAFGMAFKRGEKVQLILKAMRAKHVPEQWYWLQALANETNLSIVFIEDLLSLGAMYGLMNKADCYVSPHRSEGLGLTLIESFYLGKPVIATPYGGNMAFMPDDYQLFINTRPGVPVDPGIPIYGGEGCWSDPDVTHCAHQLRWVYEHREEAQNIGLHMQKHMYKIFDRDKLVAHLRQQFIRNGAPPG